VPQADGDGTYERQMGPSGDVDPMFVRDDLMRRSAEATPMPAPSTFDPRD
jgi:hypothetical protein